MEYRCISIGSNCWMVTSLINSAGTRWASANLGLFPVFVLQPSPVAPPPLLLAWDALFSQLTRLHRISARCAVWLWDRSCALTFTLTGTQVQVLSPTSAGYVIMILQTNLRWEPISGVIRERSHSPVLTALTELLDPQTWKIILNNIRKVRLQVLECWSCLFWLIKGILPVVRGT